MAGWHFWIDRGGTFTDIIARDPAGRLHTKKLLSENPGQYADAALAGIHALAGDANIESVKMGTTVATNALLERNGAPTLLLINQGFADLLRIGNQARPLLFDLNIRRPPMLYQQVAEIAGRTGVDGTVIEELDETAAWKTLQDARAQGIDAVAIALVHAWEFPYFEERLGRLAAQAGFTQISLSHQVSPLPRLVPRAGTTVADAYLTPVLRHYTGRFAAGLGTGAKLQFMQSHGGLTAGADISGKDAVLSGPAGGLVGAARTAAQAGFTRIIGFDMGGTSTDVALYDNEFTHRAETEIAGIQFRAPMLAIHTVAAGGGSVLSFEGGRLRAGPHSAGASPGPASYRNGGPLTVTDANIRLGKIQPQHFPAIFGPDGASRLDSAIVTAKFEALAAEISAASGITRDGAALAAGFITIAVANMAHAIRQISVQKGHNPADFALVCFGGAGGQHACLVADELGMETIFIHPLAGLLSAYGIGLADASKILTQALELDFTPQYLPAIADIKAQLSTQAQAELAGAPEQIILQTHLHLRYAGTATALPVAFTTCRRMLADFEAAHKKLFGFITPEAGIIAESISVEAIRPGAAIIEATLPPRGTDELAPVETVTMFTAGASHATPVFRRADLAADDIITGPAIIQEQNATTIIEPGWRARVTAQNHLVLRRIAPRHTDPATDLSRPDPILLELFNNLFMAVAEQCGAVLRNTARSVNIKERLDFSCAIFDAGGNLIANAPHVPVHLGAMGESVRHVIARRAGTLKPGDAVALNNPYAGGTHLPDITLITPVFDESNKAIRFFVACRGHHADIGGLTPGSTPPFSKSLEEEGVVIDNFLLLSGGVFQQAKFENILSSAKYPARDPARNIADIKAQIAANATGVAALNAVIARYGWDVVEAYMGHVTDNADSAIRAAIAKLRDATFEYTMDDGAKLKITLTIDHLVNAATIDFTGTGPASQTNFNAPPAVTTAAILYAFRCLVGADIPLNEGCLRPLTIIIPAGSFLSPPAGSAVVAGNTEVSQAVTVALLAAMKACASSQATMNNFLFGNDTIQYYETICGGAGAGPGFAGASSVHTHMTNTRITDPEIMELRYPVRVEQFSVRPGSGGTGAFPGGDGAIRKIRFLQQMATTILASRRTVAPFGLAGGGPGAVGRQWVERADGRIEPLAGCAQAEMQPGDAIIIHTPGGGGFGKPAK